MNIYYEPKHNTDVTIKMSYKEMTALRWMLTLAYTSLCEQAIFEQDNFGIRSDKTSDNMKVNLDLRELLYEANEKYNAYMDEQERKYE